MMQNTTERNIVETEVKERLKRRVVHFPGILSTGGIEQRGFIVNVSARGIGMYVENDSVDESKDFVPGTPTRLEFISPTGETLHLKCRVKWIRIHNIPHHGIIHSLGMEVIDPPAHYEELFSTLMCMI